jgi:electron transport protein HydN
LTFTEIVTGRTSGQRKVSKTMRRILNHVLRTSKSPSRWHPPFPIYNEARLKWKQVWIRTFRTGDVIAEAGDFSEWAAYLLHGAVHVYTDSPAAIRAATRRRLDDPTFNEYGHDVPGPRGRLASAGRPAWIIDTTSAPSDRLMGITSTLWNQPRSATLVAGTDCELLCVKRMVLLDIVSRNKEFQPWKLVRFWEKLPRLLGKNELFVGATNAATALAEALKTSGVACHRYDRRNRAGQRFDRAPNSPTAEKPIGGLVLFEQDESSAEKPQELYLILHGAVRLTRKTVGGKTLAHQYKDGGFFGRGIFGKRDPCPFTAEVVADTTLVQLGVDALMPLIPLIGERLRARQAAQQSRLREIESGDHIPPEGMTESVAAKLLLARDILLIDTDLCARCDECVVGCGHAHDEIARFHRTNPKMEFGHWEIAVACVHCTDAPCQAACPSIIGAITILPSGLVHVHQDRCTGCRDCVSACPFEVIVMHETADALKARRDERLNKEHEQHGVATKCDRCMTFEKEPMCVTSCPYDALRRGSPQKLFPGLKTWAEGGAQGDRTKTAGR